MTGPEAKLRDTVLVVDDTPDTLGFLTEALERSGYTALVATGGEQALALVGRITPDLILLDAMMPDVDGFETCRRLKAGTAAHVPVIFMTALSETEHVVQGLSAGGVDYVTKPIVLDELFARLRVHLTNARTAQSARMALDTSGRYLVAIDGRGFVVWSTPQAVRLLQRAYPTLGPTSALPEAVAVVLMAAAAVASPEPVILAGEGGPEALKFSFLAASGPEQFLFRLSVQEARSDSEALRARFGLTPREAEVLLWLACGKANRDIAEILDLSPRTVNKHLETIFSKLGVENRASAAVLATRALAES
ncbi:MAG TPA: response regulator transcription factor [Lichenihabitans sp.]|nr:response regulator transcription factor [Lichenihabitans sp.]